MSDSDLPAVGKLTEVYPIRVPEVTKSHLDSLPPLLKAKLNNELLVTMARVIHESKFDPSVYLSDK